MATIKELKLMMREVHKKKYESMYPDGVFALHKVGTEAPRFIMAWTKKSDDVEKFSTHYNETGFQLDNHMVFNTRKYQAWHAKTNRYNSLEKLIARAIKLNLSYEQKTNFISLYLKYSGKKGSPYQILRQIQ